MYSDVGNMVVLGVGLEQLDETRRCRHSCSAAVVVGPVPKPPSVPGSLVLLTPVMLGDRGSGFRTPLSQHTRVQSCSPTCGVLRSCL